MEKTRQSKRNNLRATPSFGVRWLGSRLSGIVAQHPDWDLRVDAAPDPTDFEREVMDHYIRYGLGGWQGLKINSAVHDHVLSLCSPAYLASLLDTTDIGARLDGARQIDSERALCQWDFWLYNNRVDARANAKSILMDQSSMAL